MLYGSLLFVIAASLGAFFRFRFLSLFNIFWGTLIVNVIGSLLIGFLALYLEQRYSTQVRTLVLVAFLGSLTTFSSYSFDMVKLFEQGQISQALTYGILSNLLCIGGCYLGWRAAHILT